MNKSLMKVAFLATVVLASGVTVYNSLKFDAMLSDVAMANVEALAMDEIGWLECASHRCFVDLSYDCLYPVDGYLIGYCPNMRGQ